jgi:signal transduction histidine kinase
MPRMRATNARWVLAVLGSAFAIATQVIQLQTGVSPERALIDVVVGETYLLGGVFAWGRQPANRTWKVMAALGVAWFVGNLAGSTVPALHAIGIVFADADSVLFNWLVLAYPAGHLASRVRRGVVIASAVGLTAGNVWFLQTGDLTPNLVVGLLLTATLAVLVPLRWLQADGASRGLLAPSVLAISVVVFAVGVGIVIRIVGVPEPALSVLLEIRDIGVLAIPIGFVVGSFQLVERELRSSRARIVEASDAERRRLERDLHDGAQQRFVSLSIGLRVLRSKLGGDAEPDVVQRVDAASEELRAGIAELRELARGIHPAVLTGEGLAGALSALAERAPVPTTIVAVPGRRLAPAVEASAYFVVSEALANIGRHAGASSASIDARIDHDTLVVRVIDNGVGGADVARGTGLRGLGDRVAALGGTLSVDSPQRGGTIVTASIPVGPPIDGPESGDSPVVPTGTLAEDATR